MAKMTVKYAQACKAMKELGFKISGDAENALFAFDRSRNDMG